MFIIHINVINKVSALYNQLIVSRLRKGKGKGMVGDKEVLIMILFIISLI